LNPKSTDESSVAKDETGKEVLRVLQRCWIDTLESEGVKGRVNEINKEVHRLLREKKELTSKLKTATPPKAPTVL
jgi:hypothetical protein